MGRMGRYARQKSPLARLAPRVGRRCTLAHGAIVALAQRQRGIVTVAQLVEVGYTRSAVSHRVRRGWLVPVLPAASTRSALYERSGGARAGGGSGYRRICSATTLPRAVWGIRPHDGEIHVTGHRPSISAPARACRSIDPTPSMPPFKTACRLTTPARTLHDLAAHLPQHELDRAVEQAQVLRLATREEIAREMPRRGKPGTQSRARQRAGADALRGRAQAARADPPSTAAAPGGQRDRATASRSICCGASSG